MFRRTLASAAVMLMGLGASPVAFGDDPPPAVARAEPMPMGYASLYWQTGQPWAYGSPSFAYPHLGDWVGYGLLWRPAHDGGAYPGWWAGDAVVLGPWSPPGIVPAAAGGSGTGSDSAKKPATAGELYDRGYEAYWAGNYAGAVELLAAAADRASDPRVWYYLALAHAARGHQPAATAAARYAAALEATAGPDALGTALERVQGPARAALNRARAEVGDSAAARAVLAARPDPRFRPPADRLAANTAR